MNSKAVILGSFVGTVAIITVRDFITPDTSWPLPVPPPYRYVGAGVAFGLLGLVAFTLSEDIAAVIAFGILLGMAVHAAQKNWRTSPKAQEEPGLPIPRRN